MADRFSFGVSKGRVRLLFSLSLLVWGTLVLRLAQIQVCSGPRYARMAREQERGVKILAGSRGLIFDRRGEVLAQNLPTYSFFSFAESLGAPRFLSRAVFRGKLSERELGEKRKRKGFVWLLRDVEKEEAEKIQKRRPRGVYVTPEDRRAYPYYPLGVDWLGFTSVDGVGQAGVELFYESYLRGDSARLPLVRDARGRTYRVEGENSRPKSGNSLVTTIDVRMQSVLEEELVRALEKTKAAGAYGIFMDPKTGELWAMAARLAGNPDPRASRQKNRLIADIYEPGSTFKLVTAAAALESRKFSAGSPVYCENGDYKIGRRTIHDVHGHGWLTFEDAVVKSSNIALAKIGLAIGGPAFCAAAKKFGFGEKTGIDLPGEAQGQLPGEKSLKEIRLATCSYGYGVAVTPLQLVSAYAAVANDGVRMKPYLVKEVRDEKGALVWQRLPEEAGRAVSEKTALLLRCFFSGVVDSGTGQAAKVEGVSVGGKTGTSKKPDPHTRRYLPGRYVSSFVGFFPVTAPRVAGLIALDEPKGAYYGGEVAAPVFRSVAEKFLTLLEEPLRPEEPEEPEESFPLLQVASAAAGPPAPAGGWPLQLVPDFSGMPVRLALREASVRGLSVRVKGKGVVREQNLPPGAPIDRTEVILSCRPPFTDE